MNSLTREVGLKVGPVMFDVFVRHYFDRLRRDGDSKVSGGSMKQGDVLYDEAFSIVKAFLNASTLHTVEELQSFSNTRTPSPPWTHVIRVLVPLICCEEAATYLIKALGGEEVARRLIGGVKWWQVRGVNGVDGQWITAKKDWQEAKKRHKMRRERDKNSSSTSDMQLPEEVEVKDEDVYDKDMDAMRCILYLHGGGYYFGSVDQERYSIQRYARKINGRVFAINYRLAPQYPFPCGLQDAIAAYLYLIRPPADVAHQAVNPAHIIIAGDSAGGGLSLALLQVIRDSGLPMPAGGVLISPWCDMTHSFPSVHVNTDTDIIPESGLSFHKPSILWPPPSEEISNRVHASLRYRIRQAFRTDEPRPFSPASTILEIQNGANIPDTPLVPGYEPITNPESVIVSTKDDECIEVTEQLQLYTRNSLLCHPLISPAVSHLGGLPPLLFIAGDKEVLKDEIIYTAHKAAYPEKYPISDRAREMYPSLNGIEARSGPTSVHLQVYDDSPHILPVLFSFTTPAKFCFRAIASFCKFVTDIPPQPAPVGRKGSASNLHRHSTSRRQSLFGNFKSSSRLVDNEPPPPSSPPTPVDAPNDTETTEPTGLSRSRPSIKRALTSLTRNGSAREKSPELVLSPIQTNGESVTLEPVAPLPEKNISVASSDVGGPRFPVIPPSPSFVERQERMAGEMAVYNEIKNRSSWECRMIRERVNIAGVTRPLELESELDACQVPPECIGKLNELTMQRYIRDRDKFDKKFANTKISIEKVRRRNLERAKQDTIKRMSVLRQTLHKAGGKLAVATEGSDHHDRTGNVLASPGWGWAWALDEGEDPPPSSIVSRRDTEEARKLAEVADQAILGHDQTFSGNNLWAVVINFLTATPGKKIHTLPKAGHVSSASLPESEDKAASEDQGGQAHKQVSRLSKKHIWSRNSSKERHE